MSKPQPTGVVHVDILIKCHLLKDHESCNWCHKDDKNTSMHDQHLVAKKITSFVMEGEDWEQVAGRTLRNMVKEICSPPVPKNVSKSIIRYNPLNVVNGPSFSKEI